MTLLTDTVVTLKITEIFLSLQGESDTVGYPTVFVRLTGCPLRCVYCDTTYAFKGGEKWQISDILQQVSSYGVNYVTVTGGEPLAQKNCLQLLSLLCDQGYRVSVETSGAIDVSGVDQRVIKVMDIKTPASGEVDQNLFSNLDHLVPVDQVKFVISDQADYRWSCQIIQQHSLAERCNILFSPVQGEQDATELAEWIIADRLPVRFQIQLHKLLWNDEAGR